ncbi:MAG: glycosyl hydrolase, partial [Phycisphaeraceae bacterium]|nr:glycosyl hydrolase [Phycisphaeraceae bacterium]
MKKATWCRQIPLWSLWVLTLLGSSVLLAAQEDLGLDAGAFSGLKLRNIGPGMKSGRISDVVKDPTRPSTWYVAVASGNVWKTMNNGTTWTPIFDHHGSYSIGCITIDPQNPQVLWLGTGENNSQRSAGYGDGVYKSMDAGKSWTHMGLKTSEHIGKILIDPRDSQVVYVASQGPLWAPGGERSLYKTLDGGRTWDAVLTISENTGVSDMAFDPENPDVLYATTYQRRRHVWALVAGGPESAIYKSTDAGKTWRKIVKGLPTVDLGRIGLTVSPQQPNVLYAIVPASWGESGFYRSNDRGETWQRMSDYITTDPQYYQELFADPHKFDRVYSVDTFLQVTEDGGKTWRPMNTRFKHVDDHALVFDPQDPEYLMIGCDGGIYETWDRGDAWRHVSNLPVTQFYRVGIDNSKPFYYVYGGTQDNGSLGAPSRTTNRHGIRSSDWFVTCGGDGYQTRVDPSDPNIVYSESQYGGLVRYDRRSGERVGIQPQPGPNEPPLVWNWDSPLVLSPHSPTRLYFAANRLFRSDDRGDSWRAISPNLTSEIDRNQLEVMDTVWSAESVWKNVWTSFYGNIVSLDESPLQEGLLYVGTDDGLIQVTEDGGHHWRKMAFFPGVPENTYVADLKASVHDVNTVFAVFNNHKRGDFAAYVLKSKDRGMTWTSISSNLPARHVAWSIQQDAVRSDLLFVGTEFGLFFSLDGGSHWVGLKGGVPTVAFRDLEIQTRECDLVCGTFGRGILILDDYSPLRHVTPELMKKPAVLFPVKRTWMYVQDAPMGGGGKASLGDGFFTAPNPPFGAVFTYRLKHGLQTRRQTRKQQETKRQQAGQPVPYPDWDALRQEDTEDTPLVCLTVKDHRGKVVRRVKGATGSGFHRAAWDLRHARSTPVTQGNGK